MTEKELSILFALMLKYSNPETLQSLYYPTINENRINGPALMFTEEQQEFARKKLINTFVIEKLLKEV